MDRQSGRMVSYSVQVSLIKIYIAQLRWMVKEMDRIMDEINQLLEEEL